MQNTKYEKFKAQEFKKAEAESLGRQQELVRAQEQELAHLKFKCKTPEASYQLNESLVEVHAFLLDHKIFDKLSTPFQIKLKGSFLCQFYLATYDCESLKPRMLI